MKGKSMEVRRVHKWHIIIRAPTVGQIQIQEKNAIVNKGKKRRLKIMMELKVTVEILGLDINNAYRLSWDDKYSELCKSQNIKQYNHFTFDKPMRKESVI